MPWSRHEENILDLSRSKMLRKREQCGVETICITTIATLSQAGDYYSNSKPRALRLRELLLLLSIQRGWTDLTYRELALREP
jgi:hypothetical protein